MDSRFEKWYDKKVKWINKLRYQLKADPENEKLRLQIEKEETQLFIHVVRSGKELEQLLIRNQEESPHHEYE